VVGARSAVFAPLLGVGVICVDEEHDQSYKQESDPRYDARTVAAKRAALEDAVAIYGSATPRPESWDKLERLELGGRLGGSLPGVRVIDLRREAGYPLSGPLLKELGAIEDRGGTSPLRRDGSRRPARDADGREGSPLQRRGARGRDRRGHGARRPRLSSRRADVPAADPARGAQWPRRAGTRADPDVPARLP